MHIIVGMPALETFHLFWFRNKKMVFPCL